MKNPATLSSAPPLPRYAYRCLVSLALCGWPTHPATAAEATAKSALTPTPPSLLNGWLREESSAWTDWDLGGQIRVRYEAKEGAGLSSNTDFIQNRDASNEYLLLREKIHVGYRPTPWLNFYVEGRDASAHSDLRKPSPDADTMDLHQAYVAVGNPKSCPWSAKVGRQELLYGDERFVGIGDWGNTGRSFDAAKLRFENEHFWVDAFSGRVVVAYDDRLNVANDYDWLSGIYASSRTLLPWQETQLFLLARNVAPSAPNAILPAIPNSPTSARDVYTFGLRVKSLPGQLGAWDYTAEAAGQLGSVSQTGVRRDLEAYALDAAGGYTWKKAWGSPRAGVGYTLASGDHNSKDDKSTTFESLFGTNHKFYGVMDLWGLRNIQSGRVSASLKPVKDLSLTTDYHLMWLVDGNDYFYPESGSGRNAKGYGRNSQFSRQVGSEIDIVADYAATSFLNLQLGYGHFFVGDYIRQSVASQAANGGARDADWCFAQVRFNF